MNTILEQINSFGSVFVDFAVPMLVQSAVLIVVLFLADLLLRKKVRAVFRYWLWVLVLIKLVLPTTLSSPVSFGSWFGDELASIKVSDTSVAAQPMNFPRTIETKMSVMTVAPPTALKPAITNPSGTGVAVVSSLAVSPSPLTWQGVVFLAWGAVASAMGLLLLQRSIFVIGLVAQAQNPTQLMNDTFSFCCGQMGIKSKVDLKVSANTASPAVCGLLRPVVLVPQNLAPTLGSSRLRPVLLHELAHIRRGDLWINLAQTILQIIYFYNPLLWLANTVIRRLREQAVDEAVQVAMGASAHQYPQTLVEVAKIAFNRPVLSLRLIGVVESKSALKSRIKRMLDRPVPKTAKLGILGLVTLLLFAAIFLPMARAESGPPEFVIKGIVTDADTGRPVAGAKVGDDGYAEGKQSATTDVNGFYSYNTWYEEHNIKCEASGYKTQKGWFGTKIFGSEKEKVIDFALEPSDSLENLNEEQKLYMEWTQERFGSDPDKSEYTKLSKSAKKELEEIWIEILKGPERREYYTAIDGLAAIKSKRAVEPLLKVAAERIDKDNRYRWQAVMALGIVGDDSVIPELIHLVYHYNQNTRFWAQISLVRLTGENFGVNWQKWADWWNSQKGKPMCSTEKVEWTSNADWADTKKQKEMDEKFIEQLRENKKGEIDKSGDKTGQGPTVVGTSPTIYADDVSPELREITVTFDERMMDKSWSWTGGEMYPKTTGRPSYDQSRTTCRLPVELEPGKVYWVGINSPSHQNFQSAQGVPAERYVILFATKSEDGKQTPIPEELIAKAKSVNKRAETPYTQEVFEDIQLDGTCLFKTTIRQINKSGSEIAEIRFINSDFVHVKDMSDAKGRPVKFTSTHDEDIYHYEAVFNEPVLPGEVMEYTSEGVMDELVKPVPGSKDTFRYFMKHRPAAGQPTLRIETYLLPEGAELVSTTPEDMQRRTKDGRIEMHVEKTIPADGSITTAFQYRLTDGKELGKIVEQVEKPK
ncbi:MAG: M56 family metallopeptidase [Phycisphaerae bacterium]|nr:M56 family metallopeptidase [Phycisphaerae bacterium]